MTRASFWTRLLGRRVAGRSESSVSPQLPQTFRVDDAERYRMIVETTQDQVFIINQADQVEYVNRAAAAQFDTAPEQLIGRRRETLFPPEIAAQQKRSLDQVFHTRNPCYTERRSRFRNRDVWLGTWLTPIPNAEGTVRAVLGVSRDITERKRAEDALRESEQWLRTIVSNVPLVLWTADREGTFTFCTGRGLSELGLTPADIIGRPLSQLPLTSSPYIAGYMQRALAGESVSGQVTLQGRTWETWFVPQKDAAGGIVGTLGLLLDVTEQRRLEEHLARTQTLETLGRLAGGIAHDINNHLTPIQGYVGMILDQIGDDKPISADLNEVLRASERAAGLVKRLLAFGRKQVVQPRALNLNEVVGGLKPMLERLIGVRVRMVFELAPGLLPINGDCGQIEQVLMNLVLNARDAMPAGGTLRIATQTVRIAEGDARLPAGQYATLVISDTGTGMDARTKERLFEPFFTTKPAGEGTGLGLSTVYGIVKQLGGYIFVDSEVGRGSTFTLYWPAVADTTVQEPPRRKEPAPAVVGRETILLVEDEDTVRAFAKLTLERRGFQVIDASSPQQALALAAAAGSINLLVTDVVMPGVSGAELAAQLKRTRPKLPVLYISGYPANLLTSEGALDDPSVLLLAKPFTSGALLAHVESALAVGARQSEHGT